MRLKPDGNAEKNLGALFFKPSSKNPNNDYILMKITVDGANKTFICFKNPNKDFSKDETLFDKNPAYFIFPYKPKDKNKENYNE